MCSQLAFVQNHPPKNTFVLPPCSKAVVMFENDPRFKALEDDREREDMFEDYLLDLEKKEKEEKKRERKKHMDTFRAFLETCDFIKVRIATKEMQRG